MKNTEKMIISKMGSDGIVKKVRPVTHPLTCVKCHRIINTQLCAKCEDTAEWLDKPNEVGWWWYYCRGSLLPIKTTLWAKEYLCWDSSGILLKNFLHTHKGKWLKIAEPTLPQE